MRNFWLLLILLTFSCKSETKFTAIQDTSKAELELVKQQTSPKILFARKKGNDGGWSIYSMDSNGQNETIVIPFKSGLGDYNPSMSPNGKDLLFNTYRYGGWKLATFNISTNELQQITKTSDYCFNGVYSEDGQKIAYERVGRGEKTSICFSDSNGLNETLITNSMSNSENRAPAWTPDNASILFYSDKNGSNDIYKYSIDDKTITNLTNTKESNNFNPSVSPDGKYVAFYSDRDGHLDVFIKDINGQNVRCLTAGFRSINNAYNYYKDSNLFWIFKIDWSPDGQSLIFSNVKGDNIDLFTIKIDGSEIKQLTKTKASEYTPVWAQIID